MYDVSKRVQKWFKNANVRGAPDSKERANVGNPEKEEAANSIGDGDEEVGTDAHAPASERISSAVKDRSGPSLTLVSPREKMLKKKRDAERERRRLKMIAKGSKSAHMRGIQGGGRGRAQKWFTNANVRGALELRGKERASVGSHGTGAGSDSIGDCAEEVGIHTPQPSSEKILSAVRPLILASPREKMLQIKRDAERERRRKKLIAKGSKVAHMRGIRGGGRGKRGGRSGQGSGKGGGMKMVGQGGASVRRGKGGGGKGDEDESELSQSLGEDERHLEAVGEDMEMERERTELMGAKVIKEFPTYGVFEGTITKVFPAIGMVSVWCLCMCSYLC